MRAKLITVFLATFAVFIAILVWRVDDMMFSDKLAWNEAQVRSQMSPLIHALEIEFKNLSETLSLSTGALPESQKDYSKTSSLSRYHMITQLRPRGGRDWHLEKIWYLEKSPTRSWASQYATLLLKNVDTKQIKPGGFAAFSLLDPQRKPFIFVVINDSNAGVNSWRGVLLGHEFFQSLVDQQKGQISTVFLVNNQGQALGHTVSEYIGNLLSEDPMVAEVMKAQSANGSGLFRDLKGENIQGFYEQVPKTNIYTVITTPVSQLLKGRVQTRWQIIFMGLGLACVGIAVFVIFYKPEHPYSLPPSVTSTSSAGAKAVKAPISMMPPTTPVEDLQKEKMQAFLRVASALSHELKNPLASILGHSQLLKKTAGDSEHLLAIEEQARKARELIQKLKTFSGEADPKLEKIKIADVVNKALRQVEAKLFRKGVGVVKEFKLIPEFLLPADLIGKAIENILNNSIEAMERVPKKELKLTLSENHGAIELTIADTGEGIEPQNLEKVFDPFFTTRPSQNHVGLGLSMSMGIMRELGGTLDIQSERGKGTTVKLVIQPEAVTAAAQSLAASQSLAAPIRAIKMEPEPIKVTLPSSTGSEAPPPRELKIPASSQELLVLEDKDVEEVLEIESMDHTASVSREGTPPPNTDAVDTRNIRASISSDDGAPVEKFSPKKIDKPKIEIQKRVSKLDQVAFHIRKPGERT